MADIRKFQGAELRNKRLACEPIRSLVSRAVRRVGAGGFRALLMPSRNMADIDEMTRHSVPLRNIVVAERDRGSFEFIGSAVKCPSCAKWVSDAVRCQKCGSAKPTGLPTFRESAAGMCLTDSAMDLAVRLSYETDAKFDYMNVDLCGPVSVYHLKIVLNLSQRFSARAILAATAKCARERGKMREVDALCRKAGEWGLRHDGSNDGRRRLALFTIVAIGPCDYGWRPSAYVRAEYPGDGACRTRMLCYACEYEPGEMGARSARSLWAAQEDSRFSKLSPNSVVVLGDGNSWRSSDA